MTPMQLKRLEGDLASFLESMFSGLGRVERRRAMDWYVKGLLLEGERKSIEPMAGRLVEQPSPRCNGFRRRLKACGTARRASLGAATGTAPSAAVSRN
ncbi:transposase [Myxococcus stipitatus]|uniref:transposase n=1 Tax=Myxococcus stipitatus TaxID=83455 RepID=UPI003CC8BF72